MKAIIMAGGEGTRLRPLTINLPKPMVKLCGRPTMEHIVLLLRKYGFTDIMTTLGYLPFEIQDYFGNGSRFSVNMKYMTEEMPMGTAGSVKRCESFIGDEDVLIISGDSVCDFDLGVAMDYHRQKNADVTIVLYRHPTPLEYGLVMIDASGAVERFIEKPSWGQVFCNTVNTGIYVIKPDVLKEIPENIKFDFARDLFPKLQKNNAKIFGYVAQGYWCDMGDTETYLQCSRDMLSKTVKAEIPAPEIKEGLFSNTPIPKNVTLIPPCYVGSNVFLGNGARIGPYCVLEDGSKIVSGAIVERSVIDGAAVGQKAQVFGAAVQKNAVIGACSGLSEGAVVGEGAVIGEGAILFEGVKVWPKKEIQNGDRVRFHVVSGKMRSYALFDDDGSLNGEMGLDLSPELLLSFGYALGSICDRCLISCGAGDPAVELTASLIENGIGAVGKTAVRGDAVLASAAAFMAPVLKADCSVFVERREQTIKIRLFDREGYPIKNEMRRKIEGMMKRGDAEKVTADRIKKTASFCSMMELYAAEVKRDLSQLNVSVGPTDLVLRYVFSLCGAKVSDLRKGKAPRFELSMDGMSLRGFDENNQLIDEAHMLAIAVLCACKECPGAKIPAPYQAPDILEKIAASYGGEILREGKEARKTNQPNRADLILRDGVFMAANIAGYMKNHQTALSELWAELPPFSVSSREVGISTDKAELMSRLSEDCSASNRELLEGVKIFEEGSSIYVTPSSVRKTLKIVTESQNMEAAEEIGGIFEKYIRRIDRQSGKIKS